MKDFYFKLNGDVITDAIDYPVDGYTKVTLAETQLPAGINGGWYRWNGTSYQEDSTLKPIDNDKKIADLQAQNAQFMLALVKGGLM